MASIERFMGLARRQALRSQYIKKVGVVFVRGRRVIALGSNKLSHPKPLRLPSVNGKSYYSLHAEIDALLRHDDLSRSTAYVFALRGGKIVTSAPCPPCRHYLSSRGISSVVYNRVDVGQTVYLCIDGLKDETTTITELGKRSKINWCESGVKSPVI